MKDHTCLHLFVFVQCRGGGGCRASVSNILEQQLDWWPKMVLQSQSKYTGTWHPSTGVASLVAGFQETHLVRGATMASDRSYTANVSFVDCLCS